MTRRVQTVHATAKTLRQAGIFHLVADPLPLDGRALSFAGRSVINFGSCSYLGLETDARLIDGAKRALSDYGTQFSTSRAYVSSAPYAELTEHLSRIAGTHALAIGSTTTLLHAAALPALIEPGDTVVFDEQVHHSVQSVLPTLAHLGAKPEQLPHGRLDLVEEIAQRTPGRTVFLADGVYSMYGDALPVAELHDILERNPRLWAYLDDAHGTGWAGPRGVGWVLGARALHPRSFVVLGMAKAFASAGACLVCPTAELADLVFSAGGTMIFSGPLQPAVLGSAIAAAKIFLTPELEQLQATLRERMAHFRSECARLGLEVLPSETPVNFVRVGAAERAIAVCRRVLDDGFFTNIATHPAVPRDGAGIRVLINVKQRADDITGVVQSLVRALSAVDGDRGRADHREHR